MASYRPCAHIKPPPHNQNGFTLVEMLVALVLLLILGAVYLHLLFLVNSGSAPGQTAMKCKGRGVWVAIVSANSDREAIKRGPLWPHEARLPIEQGGAGLHFTTATGYFKELMAGEDPEHPLVSDLRPELLSARDYPSNTASRLTAQNIAWRVADVSESFADCDAFLISKDIQYVARSGAANDRVTRSRSGPFKGKHVVWVCRSGGVFDERAKHGPNWGTFFKSTNNVPFLAD
jgi:prepilin-type N-terminal cleavage/methylation domain-containing protein